MKTEYLICLAMFSFAGGIFCTFVGSLILIQPLYMVGVDNQKSGAISCYLAGLMYALLFTAVYLLYKRSQNTSVETTKLSKSYSKLKLTEDEFTPLQNPVVC